MNGRGEFRTREQELSKLLREISDVRATVQEIGATVNRMERHVRRAFDIPKPPRKQKAGSSEQSRTANKEPTLSAEDALKLFDDLSLLFNADKIEDVKSRLQEMTLPDLRFLAHELGAVQNSRSSKKTLLSAVVGRLKERSLLSTNVNVTQPLAESIAPPEIGPPASVADRT